MATNSSQRVTFSPGEFAALFGKSQTWGYRQIYAGKVKTITEYGRILIPAAEVEKILGSAERYEGRKRILPKTKAEFQKLAPELKSAWQKFLHERRGFLESDADDSGKTMSASAKPAEKRDSRKDALSRLGRKK